MKAGTVLGISPGTKSVGLAVMRDGALVHHAVRSFSGAWSGKKLQTVIQALGQVIGRYHVTHVAVKIPDRLPDSLGFIQLLGSLNVLCDHRVEARQYYTLSELKKRHCGDGPKTAAELMRMIAAQFPELMPEYRKEVTNRNPRYVKVFEAVAAALMTHGKKAKRECYPFLP